MRQIKKRIALNDAEAFNQMGLAYIKGKRGLPQVIGRRLNCLIGELNLVQLELIIL